MNRSNPADAVLHSLSDMPTKWHVKSILLILVNLFPLYVLSQTGVITGKVTDSKTGEALSHVSVFLSNATKATLTNSNGDFILNGVKTGQYDLVVSLIGYITFSRQVNVNEDKQDINVKVEKRSVELREVIIRSSTRESKRTRDRYLEEFVTDFIGRTGYASSTKIINPEVIKFYNDQDLNELKASTDEFLVIENNTLGYRLQYLLTNFSKNRTTGMIYYEGQTLFEQLEGNESKIKSWKFSRLKAYAGSSMHFYRSLMKDQLQGNGFEMYTLLRKNNPSRPSDSLIRTKMLAFSRINNDSLNYWKEKLLLPKVIDIVIKDPLKARDIVRPTNQQQLLALSFTNRLFVVSHPGPYIKKIDKSSSFSMGMRYNNIIILTGSYALFNKNGIVITPKSVAYEGSSTTGSNIADELNITYKDGTGLQWGNGVATMLPVDYEPGF